ncbi:MAG TPA: hypothetical protein PK850_15150 [Ignavibacteria bacterium]|nr:hypothetical protein [Ignavibacteria bacterium]
MKRYGSANNLADNFTYTYYSRTNKVQSVTAVKTLYTYDANGNMTKDELNKNYNILYA